MVLLVEVAEPLAPRATTYHVSVFEDDRLSAAMVTLCISAVFTLSVKTWFDAEGKYNDGKHVWYSMGLFPLGWM